MRTIRATYRRSGALTPVHLHARDAVVGDSRRRSAHAEILHSPCPSRGRGPQLAHVAKTGHGCWAAGGRTAEMHPPNESLSETVLVQRARSASGGQAA